MSDPETAKLHRDIVAFLGRVIAIQTHETTNALNVINEMAGLQQDVIAEVAAGDLSDLPELEKCCSEIRGHVRRGEASNKSINWLAHSSDSQRVTFHVGEVITRLATVFATDPLTRHLSIAAPRVERGCHLTNNLFYFSVTVLFCLDTLSAIDPSARTVTVSATPEDGGVAVAFECDPASAAPGAQADRTACFDALVGLLGGERRSFPDGHSPAGIAFYLPLDNDRLG